MEVLFIKYTDDPVDMFLENNAVIHKNEYTISSKNICIRFKNQITLKVL